MPSLRAARRGGFHGYRPGAVYEFVHWALVRMDYVGLDKSDKGLLRHDYKFDSQLRRV